MTQKNDEGSGLAMGVALIGVAFFAFAAFVFAVAAFIAFVFTVLSFCAWNSPFTIFGHTLEPEEARRFVRNGVVGALLAPSFLLFVSVLFGVQFIPDAWGYAIIGGYAAGSILMEVHIAQELEKAQSSAQLILPPSVPSAPRQDRQQIAPPPAAPFRFASWDDEEKRG